MGTPFVGLPVGIGCVFGKGQLPVELVRFKVAVNHHGFVPGHKSFVRKACIPELPQLFLLVGGADFSSGEHDGMVTIEIRVRQRLQQFPDKGTMLPAPATNVKHVVQSEPFLPAQIRRLVVLPHPKADRSPTGTRPAGSDSDSTAATLIGSSPPDTGARTSPQSSRYRALHCSRSAGPANRSTDPPKPTSGFPSSNRILHPEPARKNLLPPVS